VRPLLGKLTGRG